MSTRKLATHCRKGHEFTSENIIVTRCGGRTCRECDRARHLKHRLKTASSRSGSTAVTCPECGSERYVCATSAKRIEKSGALCGSCSRKVVRARMLFCSFKCRVCGREFNRRSGATKTCDECIKNKGPGVRSCPVCGDVYDGYANKKACSNSCLRRIRVDQDYFGGRMKLADGWSDRRCVACGTISKKSFHIHHVNGYPDHSHLVLLCAGCHNAVSKLAGRKQGTEWVRAICELAIKQKEGLASA